MDRAAEGLVIGGLGGKVDMATPDNILWWLPLIVIWFGLMLLPGVLGIVRRTTQRLHFT
jgi:hypothetical protein